MYKHILIPTDGSELSRSAIEHGVALAKATNAKVTALTVSAPFHMFAVDPAMVTDTPDQYKKRIAYLGAKYLAVAKGAAAALDVTCDVLQLEHDHPHEAIINTAKKLGCDAVVMA